MDPKKLSNFGSNTGSEPGKPKRQRVRETPTRHLANESENTPRNTRQGETQSLLQLHVLLCWLIETSLTHTHTSTPSTENTPVSCTGQLNALNCREKGVLPPGTHHQNTQLLTANRSLHRKFFFGLHTCVFVDCMTVLCVYMSC
jgi:hypothetical protein